MAIKNVNLIIEIAVIIRRTLKHSISLRNTNQQLFNITAIGQCYLASSAPSLASFLKIPE